MDFAVGCMRDRLWELGTGLLAIRHTADEPEYYDTTLIARPAPIE